jgi:hypothetical protein
MRVYVENTRVRTMTCPVCNRPNLTVAGVERHHGETLDALIVPQHKAKAQTPRDIGEIRFGDDDAGWNCRERGRA